MYFQQSLTTMIADSILKIFIYFVWRNPPGKSPLYPCSGSPDLQSDPRRGCSSVGPAEAQPQPRPRSGEGGWQRGQGRCS